MSAIRIIKGLPLSFIVRLKDDGVSVNVNDGTWTVTAALRYQTDKGTEPFAITLTPTGSDNLVELTNEQTLTLNHLGSGYVLVVNASKIDGTIHLKTQTAVTVQNGL